MMQHRRSRALAVALVIAAAVLLQGAASAAADLTLPGIEVNFHPASASGGDPGVSTALRVLIGLTILSLAPAVLIIMTSFTRIIVVLSILRHALGMQQTPPNTVLIGMALFLMVFNMAPVFREMNDQALTPFMDGKMEASAAFDRAMSPLRTFMIRQTREQDLSLMVEVSGAKMPESIAEVSNVSLIPAFMLSELRMAFQIGFVIFLPFVLIDIVVSSLLMSMGMLMVPPMMLSLPIKILMFVLIDGWNLVIKSLMSSFA